MNERELAMQNREQVLGHVKYIQRRLRSKLRELKRHLSAFNKARRNYKKNSFLHTVLGFTNEAKQLMVDIQIVRKRLRIINQFEPQLEVTRDIQSVLKSMEAKLPLSRSLIDRLRLAADGLL